MAPLTLHPIETNGTVTACHVLDAQAHLVGSLKLIGQRWKFKAIGQDLGGALIPGGGPLTHRHNTVFDALDAVEVNAGLLGGGPDARLAGAGVSGGGCGHGGPRAETPSCS
jgi:hypothetical protein